MKIDKAKVIAAMKQFQGSKGNDSAKGKCPYREAIKRVKA